jgi:hypothetical protein
VQDAVRHELARHHSAFSSGPRSSCPKARFSPTRVQDDRSKPICSAVSRSVVCAKEWSKAPTCRHGPVHFEEGLKDYLSETLKDATLINPDIFSGCRARSASTAARNGRWPDRRRRRLPHSYCKHHSDPTAAPTSRACAPRSARPQGHASAPPGKRAAGYQRRRDGGRRLMLGVHPRAGFQGQTKDARHARRSASLRTRSRIVRSLAAGNPRGNKLLDFVIDRAESACRPPGKGYLRKAATRTSAARQTRRLHQRPGPGSGNLHRRGRFSRRSASRRATAPRRRCCRPRQDPHVQSAARTAVAECPLRTDTGVLRGRHLPR